MLLAVFKLELEMDYPSETGMACAQSPPPPQTPILRFFLKGRGGGGAAAVHRLSGTDNPSSNCPSKLTDKVRRIVHSKLRRITYLTQIIKRITHLAHEFPSLV